MIPYEDLVIALQTWRAKQGLPVAQLSGALTPPPAAPSYPATTPPGPPPPKAQGFLGNVATPPPLDAPPEDSLDVDDAALIEETHYENEGDDFAMAFPGGQPPAQDEEDSTAIGHQPPPLGRPSEMTLDEGTEVAPENGAPPAAKRNEDW